MSMKNSSDIIGNRTSDLRACSAVSQPSAPPYVPFPSVYVFNNAENYLWWKYSTGTSFRCRGTPQLLWQWNIVLYQFSIVFPVLKMCVCVCVCVCVDWKKQNSWMHWSHPIWSSMSVRYVQGHYFTAISHCCPFRAFCVVACSIARSSLSFFCLVYCIAVNGRILLVLCHEGAGYGLPTCMTWVLLAC